VDHVRLVLVLPREGADSKCATEIAEDACAESSHESLTQAIAAMADEAGIEMLLN
jgi:hypothetical protein